MSTPHVEVRATADGSSTLFVPELNEHYHSTHGALQEARHVYLAAGLEPLLAEVTESVWVLEVGFGTGLNALLTLERSLTTEQTIFYDTIEKFPLPWSVISQMNTENYHLSHPDLLDYQHQLHAATWNRPVILTPNFLLLKHSGELQATPLPDDTYHVIYFDAFAPEKQPDMWTDEVFAQLYQATAPGGVLVSYCAKGSFKRSLKAAGWLVERIPGPPGKREMTRAWKR
ncbi:tRNA (5-methylaminomethyl-2-thiouridine)(34)-methyltransferase MnmD [Hymenobacter seoulensis]